MEAPIWTMGPSCPIDAPMISPHINVITFPIMILMESRLFFFLVTWIVNDGDDLRDSTALDTGKKTLGQINHEREAGRHIEEGTPRKMRDDPGIDTKSELTCLGHGYTSQTNENWRHDPCTCFFPVSKCSVYKNPLGQVRRFKMEKWHDLFGKEISN